MDELNISGKRYLSSRRIARENGYHTDYIGQLIRSGKITGQKVGRTWYVEAGSFDAYLGQESAAAPAVEVEVAPEETVIETPIAPVVPVVAEAPVETVEPASATAEIIEDDIPAVMASEIVAEEVIAEEAEEAPVAIHIEKEIAVTDEPIATTPIAVAPIVVEESRPVAISVRASHAEPAASHKPIGLRYVSHEEPLIPEIPRSERVTRIMPQAPVADASIDSGEEVIIRPRKRGGLILVGLALVGVVVFVGSAVVSSGVSQTINIDAGNSASASYALHF